MQNLSDKNALETPVISKSINIMGQEITFETGKLGLLANGSVTIKDDLGNVLLVTVTVKEYGLNKEADWFPLVIDFQEKYYASGKIGGNRFMKREGRPSETSILSGRIIDRPIRPMFPKGIINDTQIICTVLSSDSESDMGFYGISGASLGLLFSGMPFEGPVSGIKISKVGDEYKFNISGEEEENAEITVIVAGTFDAITMVESSAKEVTNSEMLKILEIAHTEIKKLCKFQEEFFEEFKKVFGEQKVEISYNLPNEELFEVVSNYLTEEKLERLYGLGKKDFQKELNKFDDEVKNYLKENNLVAEEYLESDKNLDAVGELIYKKVYKVMRKNVLENEKRLDLRKLDEVRPLFAECSLLPRTHGSALFKRGITNALSITTLGGPDDVQLIDDMYEESEKRYIHHYNFPPFSVGEVKGLRGASRREIGHGKLAEKALESVLPSEKEFPYMIRVVSEITACNGSSSMASVCGSTLSLLDAGVPIKSYVSGIAMGMIYDENSGDYKILTDIQAQEDFLGDMDFKVAMSENGITALQLDVKIKGLGINILGEALDQAKNANTQIIGEMKKANPKRELSPFAPKIEIVQIPVDKIREAIGRGGENVQKLEKDFDVKIHIDDDGKTFITGKDSANMKIVREKFEEIAWEPQVGYKGEGKAVNIISGTGVIVEFRGKTGMIHISKLAETRVDKIEDLVKVGDNLNFEIIQVDKEKGRIGLKKV